MQRVTVIIVHGKQLPISGKQFAQMAVISIAFLEPNRIFLLSSHFSVSGLRVVGWRPPCPPPRLGNICLPPPFCGYGSPKASTSMNPRGSVFLGSSHTLGSQVVEFILTHPDLLEPPTLLQFPQQKSLTPNAHGFNRIYWVTGGAQGRPPHTLLSKPPKRPFRHPSILFRLRPTPPSLPGPASSELFLPKELLQSNAASHHLANSFLWSTRNSCPCLMPQ